MKIVNSLSLSDVVSNERSLYVNVHSNNAKQSEFLDSNKLLFFEANAFDTIYGTALHCTRGLCEQ